MVMVADAPAMTTVSAGVILLNAAVKVSSPSVRLSSKVVTATVCSISPGEKVTLVLNSV